MPRSSSAPYSTFEHQVHAIVCTLRLPLDLALDNLLYRLAGRHLQDERLAVTLDEYLIIPPASSLMVSLRVPFASYPCFAFLSSPCSLSPFLPSGHFNPTIRTSLCLLSDMSLQRQSTLPLMSVLLFSFLSSPRQSLHRASAVLFATQLTAFINRSKHVVSNLTSHSTPSPGPRVL